MLERLVFRYGVNITTMILIVVLVPAVIVAHAGVYAALEREPYPQWYWIDAGLTLLAGIPVTLLLLNLAEKMNQQTIVLTAALSKVKELEAILPMCAACSKIRDQHGCWHDAAHYIRENTNAQVSHGLCDSCMQNTLNS